MLNKVITIGRVKQIRENNLVIEIAGINKDDEPILVPCEIEDNIVINIKQYCKPGDIVGIKGKLENKKGLIIKVEKISFLTSKSED